MLTMLADFQAHRCEACDGFLILERWSSRVSLLCWEVEVMQRIYLVSHHQLWQRLICSTGIKCLYYVGHYVNPGEVKDIKS